MDDFPGMGLFACQSIVRLITQHLDPRSFAAFVCTNKYVYSTASAICHPDKHCPINNKNRGHIFIPEPADWLLKCIAKFVVEQSLENAKFTTKHLLRYWVTPFFAEKLIVDYNLIPVLCIKHLQSFVETRSKTLALLSCDNFIDAIVCRNRRPGIRSPVCRSGVVIEMSKPLILRHHQTQALFVYRHLIHSNGVPFLNIIFFLKRMKVQCYFSPDTVAIIRNVADALFTDFIGTITTSVLWTKIMRHALTICSRGVLDDVYVGMREFQKRACLKDEFKRTLYASAITNPDIDGVVFLCDTPAYAVADATPADVFFSGIPPGSVMGAGKGPPGDVTLWQRRPVEYLISAGVITPPVSPMFSSGIAEERANPGLLLLNILSRQQSCYPLALWGGPIDETPMWAVLHESGPIDTQFNTVMASLDIGPVDTQWNITMASLAIDVFCQFSPPIAFIRHNIEHLTVLPYRDIVLSVLQEPINCMSGIANIIRRIVSRNMESLPVDTLDIVFALLSEAMPHQDDMPLLDMHTVLSIGRLGEEGKVTRASACMAPRFLGTRTLDNSIYGASFGRYLREFGNIFVEVCVCELRRRYTQQPADMTRHLIYIRDKLIQHAVDSHGVYTRHKRTESLLFSAPAFRALLDRQIQGEGRAGHLEAKAKLRFELCLKTECTTRILDCLVDDDATIIYWLERWLRGSSLVCPTTFTLCKAGFDRLQHYLDGSVCSPWMYYHVYSRCLDVIVETVSNSKRCPEKHPSDIARSDWFIYFIFCLRINNSPIGALPVTSILFDAPWSCVLRVFQSAFAPWDVLLSAKNTTGTTVLSHLLENVANASAIIQYICKYQAPTLSIALSVFGTILDIENPTHFFQTFHPDLLDIIKHPPMRTPWFLT